MATGNFTIRYLDGITSTGTRFEEYEPEVLLLKEQMPDLDLSLWPRFAHLQQA